MIIRVLVQGIEILIIGALQLALVLRAVLPWLKVSRRTLSCGFCKP
jgi:hypothetical protein